MRVTLTLLLTALLGGLLAGGFSLLQPVRSAASARIIFTEAGASGLDPYTALKASERLAQSLSELLYSSTMFENILLRAHGFDAKYFPADELERRALWHQTIWSSVAAGTGLMTVTAYHPNAEQARLLVQAAADELVDKAPIFFGAGVRAQIVDPAVVWPGIARPDYLKNVTLGALAGLLLGLGWLLVRNFKRGT